MSQHGKQLQCDAMAWQQLATQWPCDAVRSTAAAEISLRMKGTSKAMQSGCTAMAAVQWKCSAARWHWHFCAMQRESNALEWHAVGCYGNPLATGLPAKCDACKCNANGCAMTARCNGTTSPLRPIYQCMFFCDLQVAWQLHICRNGCLHCMGGDMAMAARCCLIAKQCNAKQRRLYAHCNGTQTPMLVRLQRQCDSM